MASAKVPLGKTVAAMIAGVSTVCAGTYVARVTETRCVQYVLSVHMLLILISSVPPEFKLSFTGGSRYDQSTFMGRYKKMFLACDPLLLIRSDDSFRECAAELARKKEEYAKNPSMEHTPEENERLWDLKRIVDSAMPFPENGEVVPQPFRMSGYVPFNGPVSVAMIASSSTAGLLFWAWVNQSQNALVNYFNRNPTSVMSTETMMKSYGTAVTSALAVGFVLSTVIKKRFSPEKGTHLSE
jgi:sideroflexin-5